MENDFLDGIDEQFQRLMKANGGRKRNGRSMARSEDSLIAEILDELQHLSRPGREEVLAFIQSLKQKASDG